MHCLLTRVHIHKPAALFNAAHRSMCGAPSTESLGSLAINVLFTNKWLLKIFSGKSKVTHAEGQMAAAVLMGRSEWLFIVCQIVTLATVDTSFSPFVWQTNLVHLVTNKKKR